MAALVHQRCFHHVQREAVSRCRECRRFYCRECITEHGGRLTCTTCLRRQMAAAAPAARRWTGLLWACLAVAGVLLGWMFFYYLGRGLMLLTDPLHEPQSAVWERHA